MSSEVELERPLAPPPCGPDGNTRRRGETLERAIFDAVLYQLQAVGYAGLTMEGIAGCARTGKAALYRRWASKEDLVVDALNHLLPPVADLPDHGNLRDDLLELMRRMTAMVNSATGCALRCVLAEIDQDHPFVRLVHERVMKPRKQMFQTVLKRGVERGEARPDALNMLLTEVGPAMVAQRFLADGPPVPDDFVVSVVDDIVMPLLRP
jgi:AcrR family transcriptional regulator